MRVTRSFDEKATLDTYMKLTSVEFQDTQSITFSLLMGVSTLDGEKQMNYIIFS